MPKVLIICGPTASGKTKFGISLARKFTGEIISADSRQVYTGRNLIHGKDLPQHLTPEESQLVWRGQKLKFYEIGGIKIWLYDIVSPDEKFSVALWRECADIVINDINSRSKLPIVVGGSGLYLKSLTHQLDHISIPPNIDLRRQLGEKSPSELFNYLNQIDSLKAASLNQSDRKNSYRLIRAVELSTSQIKSRPQSSLHDFLQIGLTASRDELFRRVNSRVLDRISAGAASEDSALASNPQAWQVYEHKLVRRQLTWFKKQPNINWFDISTESWIALATSTIETWYNSS